MIDLHSHDVGIPGVYVSKQKSSRTSQKTYPKISKTHHTPEDHLENGQVFKHYAPSTSKKFSLLLLNGLPILFSSPCQNHAFQRRLRTAVRYQRPWLWEAAGVDGLLEGSASYLYL